MDEKQVTGVQFFAHPGGSARLLIIGRHTGSQPGSACMIWVITDRHKDEKAATALLDDMFRGVARVRRTAPFVKPKEDVFA
jgi:hypothetical protein